ncbi:hypothetical protein PoB_004073100 [Plakobranchus ocellatus]|uniref:Uncharacterized protein n=1 Tax=Plakobranchus ocellatus TaxID=259542 RepID=A0AAV4B151_9GAST|nr:hypothetical protein PoB_004073100 [Plakobranchus ocellatus]
MFVALLECIPTGNTTSSSNALSGTDTGGYGPPLKPILSQPCKAILDTITYCPMLLLLQYFLGDFTHHGDTSKVEDDWGGRKRRKRGLGGAASLLQLEPDAKILALQGPKSLRSLRVCGLMLFT